MVLAPKLASRLRSELAQDCLRLLSAPDFASDLTFRVYCEFSREYLQNLY